MQTEFTADPTVTVLLELAWSRNIPMLDRHYTLGRPILCCDCSHCYGIHRAASRGFTDVVEWFLDHGMDVNVHNGDDLTFGVVGASYGHFDIIHLFLDCGGSEECLEFLGMNALQRSIFFGESDADIFAIINDAENPSMLTATTSNFGFQASHFAAHFGRLDVLRALVEAGADPDPSSTEGLTPFHLAAQRGHFDVMKYLHSVDVNTDAQTSWQENAAHFAASLGNVEILQWLDSLSVDMCCYSAHDQTILTCAVEGNQYECCRWLLEEGGYHHLLDGYPDVDLTVAFRTQNLPIARLLLSHGAHHNDPTALASSCFHTELLELCAEFEVLGNSGSTALWKQDWDAFYWLVSHGHFSWVQTAFELPHFDFPLETFHELKRRGFDFHILNGKGQNLLFSRLKPAFFQFLIEEGVNPNVNDADGNCAWRLSSSRWKRHSLILIGACPEKCQTFLNNIFRQAQTVDELPDNVDIWDVEFDVINTAKLRLLAIHAILNRAESLIVSINQQYALALWAAAIVVENGVDILKEFGIHIDFDELQTAFVERRLTYLANRCRDEKRRSLISLNHVQIL